MMAKITIEVEAPEGATHYAKIANNEIIFLKIDENLVGKHWRVWLDDCEMWHYYGKNPPPGLIQIKPQTTEKEQRGEDKA